MLNHPLLPYVTMPPTKYDGAVVFTLLGLSTWAIFQEPSLFGSNPVSNEQAQEYFKIYLDRNKDQGSYVREMISSSKEYAQRDDQVKFYIQLKRYMLYLEQIIYKPSDSSTQSGLVHSQPYLETISNDMQKFNFARVETPYDKRDSSLKQIFVKASKDMPYYQSMYSRIKTWCQDLRRQAQDIENDARHFLDLMYNNRNYKNLQKISWYRKADELFPLLHKHHDLILEQLGGKELITATPERSEDFLVINEKLKWVLIESNFCPYEEEIMGHCATAPRGCRLLSLREYSTKWPRLDRKSGAWRDVDIKTPEWLSRVTATICPEIDKHNVVTYRFSVQEILGPKNQRVDKKWKEAIKALYEHPDIVEQKAGSHNAFMTKDLELEEQEALYEKKPTLAPSGWAIRKAKDEELGAIFLKEMAGHRTFTWLKGSLKYEGDGHYLLAEKIDASQLFDKVDEYTNKYDTETLKGVVEAYQDPYTWTESGYDYYPRWSDVDESTYLALMTKSQLKKAIDTSDWKSIDKSDVPEELAEAMRSADSDGHRAGYENSISNYAYQVLKEVKFKDKNGDESAFVDHNNGKWQFWVLAKDLRRMMAVALEEDISLDDYIFDELDIQKTENWRIEGDFDSEVATERFKELVSELYGK